MSSEKTEKPTEQRKKQARQEGQVPSTPDFGAWSGILLASFLIPMVVRSLMERTQKIMETVAQIIQDPTEEQALALLRTAAWDAVVAAAPLCVGLLLVSIATSAAQNGMRPASKQLMPKFSRLNPVSGFKRAFGGQAAWEATKTLLKTIAVGIVLYITIKDLVPLLLTSGSIPFKTLLETVGDAVLAIIRTAGVAGLVMAGADYGMARRRVGKQTRMSKEEVKEENKRTEGDPQLKSAIRGKQMAMSRQRMMSEVPKADVVLLNPTHYAVALRYDPSRGAPRVVAKGAGAVAVKIREKATEHRIPMVQDAPLTRALYRDCELGEEIPADFYEAVARVLAFIMMLKAKGSAAGLHRGISLR